MIDEGDVSVGSLKKAIVPKFMAHVRSRNNSTDFKQPILKMLSKELSIAKDVPNRTFKRSSSSAVIPVWCCNSNIKFEGTEELDLTPRPLLLVKQHSKEGIKISAKISPLMKLIGGQRIVKCLQKKLTEDLSPPVCSKKVLANQVDLEPPMEMDDMEDDVTPLKGFGNLKPSPLMKPRLLELGEHRKELSLHLMPVMDSDHSNQGSNRMIASIRSAKNESVEGSMQRERQKITTVRKTLFNLAATSSKKKPNVSNLSRIVAKPIPGVIDKGLENLKPMESVVIEGNGLKPGLPSKSILKNSYRAWGKKPKENGPSKKVRFLVPY